MSRSEPSIIAAGARAVWRQQAIVWGLFAVNFLLALLSTLPISSRLHPLLDHSLYAQHFSRGMDASALTELMNRPEGFIAYGQTNALLPAVLFFFVMLFCTGGVLSAYGSPKTLSVAEFFQSCGAYLFRLVRLLVLFVCVLVVLAFIATPLMNRVGSMMDDTNRQAAGFWVMLFVAAVLVIVVMIVRLWFDMAQVRLVAEDQRSVLRCIGRGCQLTFGNFGTLFWMYCRLSLLGWLVVIAGALVWLRLPPNQWWLTLVLWEAVAFVAIVTRLWQRAGEAVWYQRYRAAVGNIGATAPTADPSELVQATPQ